MLTCPTCGEENPDRARFCLNCATPLGQAAAPREERKVVTVLFSDLVGFTSRSDRADPEDVKALLRPFHARLKREIEAFGGTLDKFIGDAALGVFGSPVAHEDDPERAVRAGLAIVDAMSELRAEGLPVDVRIGINTGEAVVAYGASGPQIGEAVTGDVVNTASRLQSAAPVNGVLVGESTYRATRRAFVYEHHQPVTAKGKAEPLWVWVAREPIGRVGAGLTRSHATPYVGRELEQDLLRGIFARTVRDRSVHLVTVAGEPGVGKSRLVAELARYVDGRADLVTWRHGRCLPYGEGITFWALGEIVKAHAGILDSDGPEAAGAKLDAVLPVDERDREWLRRRLEPLVGTGGGAPTDREESFTAWRRFLEGIAATGPAVFVFEDLHWADAALLEFLEHVAESSEGAPMLLVGTARPELYERHPTWAGGKRNATTVSLSPLSDEETAALVSELMASAALPAGVRDQILERAGGNPLYAEEFVRMLEDRGLLREGEATSGEAGVAEVPFPDSLQALIAARLDTVSPDRKSMLQDAAVLGKTFWAEALEALGNRGPAAVAEGLHDLSRRELIRPARESSMQGQAEFAFWHALVRDVAYAQIPRAARSDKHRAAAGWIEEVTGPRALDHAEILAHHYGEALALARAAGRADAAEELEGPALQFLVAAGDRALGLDVAAAERHYAASLELAPEGHPERPRVLALWADAARQSGRLREAAEALEASATAFQEGGDPPAAARALGTLASVLQSLNDPAQEGVAARAIALLESEPPDPDLVSAYVRMGGVRLVLGDSAGTLEWVDRAAALARDIGAPVPARALGFRGFARCAMGDPGGERDMREALADAIARGESRDAAVLYNNLAVAVSPIEGPRSVVAILRDGVEFSERRGIAEMALAMTAGSLDSLFDLGEWDRAMELAATVASQAEGLGDAADVIQARWVQARILAYRGEVPEAAEHASWVVDAARESGSTEDVVAGFSTGALVLAASGDAEGAVGLLREVDGTPTARENAAYPARLPEMVRTALLAGDRALAVRLADGVDPGFPYREHAVAAARALLAEADGDHREAAHLSADAAARWERFGVVPERGQTLLALGRSLVASGRAAEATAPLAEARDLFARLGARPPEEESQRLLAMAGAS